MASLIGRRGGLSMTRSRRLPGFFLRHQRRWKAGTRVIVEDSRRRTHIVASGGELIWRANVQRQVSTLGLQVVSFLVRIELSIAERCRSGRTGRSRKPLSLLRGTEGSNPSLSATYPFAASLGRWRTCQPDRCEPVGIGGAARFLIADRPRGITPSSFPSLPVISAINQALRLRHCRDRYDICEWLKSSRLFPIGLLP
jgi:hypothetical protein